MNILKMTDLDLKGKRVLIREDLNVPVADGKVTSDARIRAALPTVQMALKAGACVLLVSHLGRPKEGEYDPALSLAPVAEKLTSLLGVKVPLVKDWIDGVDVAPGTAVLCENVRFLKGEKKDDEALARKMAALCDIYVMDAFGTAHRAEASTHGVGKYAPVACAGPLLAGELEALGRALANPARPLVAIVAGSKVSTKLTVLESLTKVVDQLIVGGGIANTFIAAAGHKVGKSLYEAELVPEAKRLTQAAKARGGEIPLPVDVVTATAFDANAEADVRKVDAVGADEMILDIGPDTAAQYAELLKKAGTIVWNGPVGVFEIDATAKGTIAVAEALAKATAAGATTIIGGGDSASAVKKAGVASKVSHVSTGGGASLEYLEGKVLPGVAALTEKK